MPYGCVGVLVSVVGGSSQVRPQLRIRIAVTSRPIYATPPINRAATETHPAAPPSRPPSTDSLTAAHRDDGLQLTFRGF